MNNPTGEPIPRGIASLIPGLFTATAPRLVSRLANATNAVSFPRLADATNMVGIHQTNQRD